MPELRSHKPGMLCFADLCASDLSAARGFYGELFGWSFDALRSADGRNAALALRDGKLVCAVAELMPAQRAQRLTARWTCHFAVTSAVEAAQRGADSGARLLAPPFSLGAAGELAVVADPFGAQFGLWQGNRRIGAEALGEPGALTWAELETHDIRAAGNFYGAIFGWSRQALKRGTESYTVFNAGDRGAAGMAHAQIEPARWTPWFEVADCDEAVQRAIQLGGQLVSAPRALPLVGRLAALRDPEGARFAVLGPAR